jgi:hypothetical protein
MKFFTIKRSKRSRHLQYPDDWKKRVADYEAHLERIRPNLPPGFRRLSQLELHDARLSGLDMISKNEVKLSLKNPAYDDFDSLTLTFLGVRKHWVPYSAVNMWWLHTEVDLHDSGAFEMRALLEEDEIMVVADEVRVETA